MESKVLLERYGTHTCTCDGCTASPIVGFRFKCTKCPDHDICENCHDQFLKGTLPHVNKLNPNISRDPADHAFTHFADRTKFQGMLEKQMQATKPKDKKPKPNDKCSCGSDKKYKKCCQSKE